MWAQIIGAVADAGFSLMGESADIDKQNDANKVQWKDNVELTQHMIGTLAYRTSQEQADIRRDKINTILAARKVVRQKEGKQAVGAAQMGAAGKRPELILRTTAAREGADIITEAELRAEMELRNSTSRYTDTAQQMIDALNVARPTYQNKPSAMNAFMTLGMTGANEYFNASSEERVQFGNSMRSMFSRNTTSAYKYPSDMYEPSPNW